MTVMQRSVLLGKKWNTLKEEKFLFFKNEIFGYRYEHNTDFRKIAAGGNIVGPFFQKFEGFSKISKI